MHLFLFFLAIASLSQAANLAKLAQAPVAVIGFWRLIIAAIVLSPLFFRQPVRKLGKQEFAQLVISSLFFFTHLWTYTYAAMNTRIANCVILFAINPLFTALIAKLWFKEHFSRYLALTYLLAMIGIGLLFKEGLSTEPEFFWGNIAAILSGALYSGYLITGRQARQRSSNITYTFWVYLIAAACFFLTGATQRLTFVNYPPITWLAIAGLVVFATLLGHALFSYLLKFLNINWMSCGKLIEPALSSIVAFVLFKEQLSITQSLAYAFSASSVLILVLSRPKLK